MERIVKILVFFNVFIYASYVYLYFFQFGYTSIKPVYWYVLTIGSAVSVLLLRNNVSLSFNLVMSLITYLSFSIFSFIISHQSAEAIGALIVRVESVAILLALLILMKQSYGIRTVKIALLFVTVVGVSLNTMDFLSPYFSKVPGRAAGLYWNPNIAGSILVLSMVASVDLVSKRFRFLYCILVGLGVLITFSRGGWVLWILSLIGLIRYGVLELERTRLATLLISSFVILFVTFQLSGDALDNFHGTGTADFLTPNTLARIGVLENASVESSTAVRLKLARHALSIVQERPWLGYGLGFTKEWSESHAPHNMFLLLVVEQGLIGLLVVCTLLAILWRSANNTGRLLVVLFVVASMFSHNTLDQPAMLIILSFVAAFSKQTKSESDLGFSEEKMFQPNVESVRKD